jgi:hypothetical protein
MSFKIQNELHFIEKIRKINKLSEAFQKILCNVWILTPIFLIKYSMLCLFNHNFENSRS